MLKHVVFCTSNLDINSRVLEYAQEKTLFCKIRQFVFFDISRTLNLPPIRVGGVVLEYAQEKTLFRKIRQFIFLTY